MTDPGASPYDRPALVAAARRSIRQGSKSFATASRLFDGPTRERVWLLYAWCRACDDIADEQDHGHARDPASLAEPMDAAARLATIRTLTELAMAGEVTGSPAFDALGQLVREVPLTQAMVDDVLAGFALDAADWRPVTEADLLRYCYHVAGAVGVLMAAVMGVSADDDDPLAADTLDRACDLGLAFQLANIARDIADDHAIGRCYLPAQWLAESGISADAVLDPRHRPALVALARRICTRAQEYEVSARTGARRLPWRQRWAVLSAAGIYGAIGREVSRRGDHAWDRRAHVPAPRKAMLMAGALRASLGPVAPGVSGPPGPALSRRQLARLARQPIA
ncbi:phytoene/squalene synthase family protein [Novosphingobium colocasiae]|uniref:Phytoene synthase n=1 Tax=Novosphingobium colocasiae TaxID=1256513 RepID=A0A918PLY4_9SPHN|nr:phytoene/squalene synthase family protein [Novosphingobium colocasiae]GGZ14736.1 phytoene synthase [Novosphingobium colocasiae]